MTQFTEEDNFVECIGLGSEEVSRIENLTENYLQSLSEKDKILLANILNHVLI